MKNDSLALFRRTVEVWRRRKDPTERLTLNQITSVVLGRADAINIALMGRMLYEYRVYVHSEGFHHGRRYSPNWLAIDRDFPPPGPPPVSLPEIYTGLVRALEDEERAVRQDIQANPIAIFEGRRAPELESSGDVIYRFTYWQERDDTHFSIPDGVPVRLFWRDIVRDGILLSEDSAQWQLYVALDSPIDAAVALSRGKIQPRLEELVAAVRRRIDAARSESDSLHSRLLLSKLEPRHVRTPPPSAGTSLDASQLAAVAKACSHDITFIWGPPGTGKTHTIGEILTQLATAGLRTLAVSIANVAVDQICLKTRDALLRNGATGLLESGQVLRVGHPRDPEVLRERRFFPDREEARVLTRALARCQDQLRAPRLSAEERARIQKQIADLRSLLRGLLEKYLSQARLVFSTVLQPCLSEIFDTIGKFDVVVIDEASMLPIPHLVASASRAASQVVIAGDFRQLGPIALSKSDAAHRWLHRDAFDILGVSAQDRPSHPALAMLTLQRRMHPHISGCINQRFYGALLQDGASADTTRACSVYPFCGDGVVFIDISAEADCRVEKTAAGSRRNLGSATRTVQLAAAIARAHVELQVAIITPYRAQVSALKDLVKRESDAVRDQIRVGTIHTFQGSERDVVIWDWVENRHHSIGRLYRGREGNRLTNVAISRAKGKLLVVGDPRTFNEAPGHEAVDAIKAILHNHLLTRRVPWSDVADGLADANPPS